MLRARNTWYDPFGHPNSPLTFKMGSGISEVWALSTLINLYMTSGLAYLRMEAIRNVMVEYTAAPNDSYLVSLLTFGNEPLAVGTPDYLLSWLKAQPYGTDNLGTHNLTNENYQWTKQNWLIFRYGYGWGMHNTTIELAAATLLLYAVLAVAHICVLLYRGWVPCQGWKSLGELVILALGSPISDPNPQRLSAPRQESWWLRRVWSWWSSGSLQGQDVWRRRIRLLNLKDGMVFEGEEEPLRSESISEDSGSSIEQRKEGQNEKVEDKNTPPGDSQY